MPGRYSQDLVIGDGILAAAIRYARASLSIFQTHKSCQGKGKAHRSGHWGFTHEVFAHFTGHVYPVDPPKSVIQFLPARFIPTLHGTAIGRDLAIPRRDPFHLGGDGQELVPPVVADFGVTPCDATWREKGKIDLARVNRGLEDRGTNEDRVRVVCSHVNG